MVLCLFCVFPHCDAKVCKQGMLLLRKFNYIRCAFCENRFRCHKETSEVPETCYLGAILRYAR